MAKVRLFSISVANFILMLGPFRRPDLLINLKYRDFPGLETTKVGSFRILATYVCKET